MKQFGNQLKKAASNVTIRAAERRQLRERVVAYMEYHPLPRTKAKQKEVAYLQTEPYKTLRINWFYVRGLTGALVLFLIVGVPLIAERALPGDVLYPVKVQFNEELLSTLSSSPYAKVEWETERLERRIAEARLLASEGKLTDEVQVAVVEAVKHHSDNAKREIEELRAEDQDEAAIAEISFASALEVQSEVLESAVEKEQKAALASGATSTPGSSVAALASVVAEESNTANLNQDNVVPSYERLAARLEQETTRTYELFDSVRSVASKEEVTDFERRLSDIERKITKAADIHAAIASDQEAESATDAEAKTDADTVVVTEDIVLLRSALSDLRKLISFMTDIDVRENVTIEELVPVTYTDEERLAAIADSQERVDAALASFIAAREGSLIEADIIEKFDIALAKLEDTVKLARLATTDRDLDAAERLLAEAEVMVNDLTVWIGPISEPALDVQPDLTGDTTTSTSSPATATSTEPTEVEPTASTTTDVNGGAADPESPIGTTTQETTNAGEKVENIESDELEI